MKEIITVWLILFISNSFGFICSNPNNVTTTYFAKNFLGTPMETCCWYSTATCCYDPGTDELDTAVLITVRQILDTYSKMLTSECYYNVADVACFYCNPSTGFFLNFTQTSFDIYICTDICERLFLICNENDRDVMLNGRQAQNSTELCQIFFGDRNLNAIVVPFDDPRGCFFGVGALQSSIIANIDVCLSPSDLSIASINSLTIYLILLIVFCLINL